MDCVNVAYMYVGVCVCAFVCVLAYVFVLARISAFA